MDQLPSPSTETTLRGGPGFPGRHRIGLQLLLLFLVRTALNAPYRMVYPFLPSIARGLGVSLTQASRLITLRAAAGAVGPFLGGPLADRHGRRPVMELALALTVLATLLLAGFGGLTAAAVAFVLCGAAKVWHDSATHAHLGDTVPYSERGRAVAAVELSWSGAWLLGVPLSGLLIERLGWRAPWALWSALVLVSLWITHVGLPSPVRSATAGNAQPIASLVTTWRSLLRRRAVVIVPTVSLLLTLAIEIPFIVYGAWLERTFQLSLTALGLASAVVGFAEAAAELGATVVTDRLGKRRSVLAGLLGVAGSLLVLPQLSTLGLAAVLAGIALLMLAFEFGLVSLLPLVTELAPDARASLLSLTITAFSLGRMAGSWIGGWLWQWQSMALNSVAGAACALAGALVLARSRVEVDSAAG